MPQVRDILLLRRISPHESRSSPLPSFVCLFVEQCPIEPTISFGEALRDRAYWLVGLLLMQSFSGIILSRNEALLADHPVIIFFLTMLVGAGGNAGNQASVRGKTGMQPNETNQNCSQNQYIHPSLSWCLLSHVKSLFVCLFCLFVVLSDSRSCLGHLERSDPQSILD